MRLLLVCLVLLGWIGLPHVVQVTFPSPLFVAAGVLLAIASNSSKSAGLFWRALPAALPEASPEGTSTPEPSQVTSVQPVMPPTLTPSTTPPVSKAKSKPAQPELPQFDLRPRPTVTFVIRKPLNQEWPGANPTKK